MTPIEDTFIFFLIVLFEFFHLVTIRKGDLLHYHKWFPPQTGKLLTTRNCVLISHFYPLSFHNHSPADFKLFVSNESASHF